MTDSTSIFVDPNTSLQTIVYTLGELKINIPYVLEDLYTLTYTGVDLSNECGNMTIKFYDDIDTRTLTSNVFFSFDQLTGSTF